MSTAEFFIFAGILSTALSQHHLSGFEVYKGADSLVLTRRVAEVMRERGYRLGNVDATIIAQAPKMAPHIPAMRQNIADAFGVDVDRVSVKATTEERLGFTGAGEGIAAHAVCLLESIVG